ncbi:MAG: hypothetical protein CM1200mP15_20200 [Dehalococcoidia bacterium]|nr:MAG: hypothetical protein CM1200mP15_20200 [Dehalococcoidia bacterium]
METSTYESKLSVERIWIAILVILGHLGVGLNVFSVSPILLEIINDLDVSHGSAGLLISLPPLAAAVFGIPGGLVAVKLGQFRAFALGLLLMGAVSLSFILSDFISLLTLRLLYGVGAALILTVVGPILIQWFNSKQLLIVNSLNAAMMTIGIGISVSLGAKVSDYIGWQLSLSVLGVIPLLTLLIWIWKGNSQSSLDPDQRLPKPSEIISLIKRKAILLLLAADAGVMFQYTALSGWLPTVYTQDHGMNVQIAGLSASFLPLAGIIGCFPGRFSTTKIGVRSHLPSYRRNISSHRRTCHVPSGEPIANLDLAGNRRDWIMVVFADTTIRNYESCIVHQKRCGYSLGGYANVPRWWNVHIPCFSRLHP